jgi:FkbM family methyltransferase
LRDLAVECLAFQPFPLKQWEYRHLHRYLLGGLFRLEKDRVVISGAGPAGQRFRMRLSWQGHTECVLGIYEPSVIRALQRYLRPGDTCLDVGSHVGYLTILMSHLVGPQGCVAAFEPVPESFHTLHENVALNHLQNVRAECMALGEREGAMTLFCDSAQELSWTPSVAAYTALGADLKRISVPVRTLDDYLRTSHLHPNLVKIDVEGAELSVLRGASQMLREARPVVLIEIHDLGPSHRADILNLLHSCRYSVEEVDSRNRETFCLALPQEANPV